jgi:hypothetical protein
MLRDIGMPKAVTMVRRVRVSTASDPLTREMMISRTVVTVVRKIVTGKRLTLSYRLKSADIIRFMSFNSTSSFLSGLNALWAVFLEQASIQV